MITPEQLARIEWLIKSFTKGHISKDDYSEVLGFVPDMLNEITRLQTTLTAKDRVLSQFADTANWEYDPPLADESFPLWAWTGDDNPVHLANQALSEGKE